MCALICVFRQWEWPDKSLNPRNEKRDENDDAVAMASAMETATENKENSDPKSGGVQQENTFNEKNINISVDLVDAARKQLVFLREVDKHPDLYSGELVRKAIRRYELFWLPLAAEHSGKEIAPPLDVHWVWHVHMLAPYYYEKDCLSVVQCVPDHKLMSDNSRHAAMERAKAIWEDR